jgi:hypothetical protein
MPLQAAIRRHIVSPIGAVPIPEALQEFPTMRSGDRKIGWHAFTERGGVRKRFGPTDDRTLPIYQVVNDTMLKEMVVSDWHSEDVW